MSAAVVMRQIDAFERSHRTGPKVTLRRARMVFGKFRDGLGEAEMARLCPARWLVIEHFDHQDVVYVAGFRSRAAALLEFARMRREHEEAGLPVEMCNGCLLILHPGRAVSCLRVENRETWLEWSDAGVDCYVEPADGGERENP